MIPPNLMPPATGQSVHFTTNKITQEMKTMKLDSVPLQNYGSVNIQHVKQTTMLSSQNRGHSTNVTYSGPPHAIYPYNNNLSSVPTSPENNCYNGENSFHVQANNKNTPPKMIASPSQLYTQNGNRNSDMKLKNETLAFQNPAGTFNQQVACNTAVNSPPNFNLSHQLPLNSFPSFQSMPPVSNPPHAISSPPLPPSNYENSLPCSPPPPIGFASPPPLQPRIPQYSGVSPGVQNAGGVWPNQQFPGADISPGYPPGQQSQGIPQQQRPQRLDLDQMPSNVQVREDDRKKRGGYYPTDVKGQPPPLVTTDFIVQDRGMCSPRFIRSTVYCLPNQPDMLKQTGIPFALTVSPLSKPHEEEKSPPVALFREQGPLRCKRCKAYICPFMSFLEGGRCFQCAFCKVVTEVPQDYFCFLDGMGERTDKYHRPELCLGSYEFLATKEYCRNEQVPNPPAYIFMMEVSNATFRNGLIPLLCENMKTVLQSLKNDEQNDTSKLRVGFVTYNSVLHFYNMKKNLTQPHIMVLSDVHNAFVPLLDGFLVTLSEAEVLIDCLMEHILRLFINEPSSEIILGPVIQVGLEALKNANCSGKLLVFHSTIPNADAPGKLPHREGQKLLGTDKQKTVLNPQHDFYYKLAEECVAAGCAVDLFLFPSAYIDIATMAPLCRHTGGQIYKYTYFQSHVDGDRFLQDLERNLLTLTAFDAVLRVRTSAGISPVFYYGNFYMSNTTDVELSALDGNKAITIEMAYDDKIPENDTIYVQAALLYTSITGERRIQVHNLAVPTSVGMPDVFTCCDMDTIINFFAKQALKQVFDIAPQQIRSNLVNRAVKILSCYRKHCATNSSSGQLILPDSLKLLPLYINCLMKSDAIAGGSEMSLDDRSFAMNAVNTMDVKNTAIYFYPRLIPLHDMDPDSQTVPSPIRCSIEKLNDNGAYLLENGIYMFLWIGQAISSDWLQNVFGVLSPNQVDKQKTSLPDLDTALSKKICHIIEELEEGRQWYMRLRVMVQGDKMESVFRQFLVEDRGIDGSASYVDFLCLLHREISKNM